MIVSKNYRSLFIQRMEKLQRMIENEEPHADMRPVLNELFVLSEQIQFSTETKSEQEVLNEMSDYCRNNGC